MIELRSDTFTQPTAAMKQAMFSAPLGDDVFAEDPTVNKLQEYAATLFGVEAALYCPSGTMTNQIAMMVHCQPGDEIICEQKAHVYKYEGGGMMTNAYASPKLVEGERGLISIDQVQGLISPDDPHFPRTKLLCLENTSNGGGGSIYSKISIEALAQFCKQNGLGYHLDGARLFNAIIESDYDCKFIGSQFHSISICLSKGLGAPVGSLLLGSKEFIKEALRCRKRLGGGMRQAGILAAAGLYALENHVERLAEDHKHAKALASCLEELTWVDAVRKVESNILIFKTDNAAKRVEELKQKGVLCLAVSSREIRMVTHLNFSQEDLKNSINILTSIH